MSLAFRLIQSEMEMIISLTTNSLRFKAFLLRAYLLSVRE